MSDRPNILYVAEATATGGREGHSRTSDGRVDVDLDVPTEMGGTGGPGTNPEQLFATGYAACFQSALLRFAAGRKLDLSNSRITARVGIGLLDTGGMGLAAAIDLEAPVREVLMLELPLAPLCAPDCLGICPTCGVDRNERSCECPPPAADPRWAALDALRGEEALRGDEG